MVEGKVKQSIWYAGIEVFLLTEVPDTAKDLDDLQEVINHFNKWGRKACATHENGRHQFYAEKVV